MRLILFLICVSHLVFAQPMEKAIKLIEAKNISEAKKILGSIKESDKEYAGAQFWLGRISYDEKKYDEAESFFERAIEANDKQAEYYNWYGNTLGAIASDANMFKQGMLAPKMKSAWEKAVALKSDYIEPRQSLIQYYLSAPSMMGGSVDKAKEMANEIMKLKPAQGHLQLGSIYLKEKNYPAAEKEFITMAKLDPAYQSTLANYYLNQKQFSKAFDLLEESLKKNPDDMLSTYQLGKTSAISGDRLERGEACLKKYLTYQPQLNEPSHAGAQMRLAQIVEKKGNKAEAKKLFTEALKGDASLKEAKEGLERVSK
jgi:tetratricopeptide (TPR) repeat protein